MPISDRVKKGLQDSSFISRLAEEKRDLIKNYGADKVFDLTPDYPQSEPPESFNLALKKLLETPRAGLHRYMENAGYIDTRSAIAAQLTQETGLKFTLNEVIMTSGATGALNMSLKALLNPGEEVIIFAPFNFEYTAFVDNYLGLCKIIPTDANFMPDLKALEAAISPKTKALLINSPNNPTGAVYSESVLKEIAAVITRKSALLNTRVYVISDDTYHRFYYDGTRCPWILNYYPHSIAIRSYSKELSVPGERIGYAAVNSECEESKTVIGALIHANRTLGFVNAPALMQNTVRDLSNYSIDTAKYKNKRDFLFNNLAKMGYSVVKPQGGLYLFPRTPIKDDFIFADDLKKQMVLTLPGSLFHSPGHLRVSFCVDDKVLEDSLSGFQKYFIGYHNQ